MGIKGLRDPSQHATAAYLASLGQTRDLCKAIDEHFDISDTVKRPSRGGSQYGRRASIEQRGNDKW